MRPAAAVVCLCALAPSARAAAAPALLGGLEPGPHAVGFRQIERLDRARPYFSPRALDGRPRESELARPLRISVWYPAEAAAGPALTVGDYVALMGVEDRLGPVSPEQARAGERTFFAFPLLRDLDDGQRRRLLALPGIAHRDAPPARGRFPVVLYSLGSAALGNATPELLASRGYIVAQAPRLGAFAGLPPDGRDALDLQTKLEDLEQVVTALAEVPEADVSRLAAIGFSAGGRWALHLAMSNAQVRAVVSLDSVVLFDDAVGRAWRQLPRFDLAAVRVPVLHAIRKEWAAREDAAMWAAMRFAERLTLRFDDPVLDHLDFQSAGLAQTLAGGRPAAARAVRAAFVTWNRFLMAFLDAHVLDRDEARRSLARAPAPGAAVTVTRLAAEPAPPSTAALMNEIAVAGPAAAVATARRLRPGVAEADLVLAGYTLLLTGRERDALPFFQLLVDSYPSSANAHDSLGDACLATGDRECARRETDAAQRLLDADRQVTAERRAAIQKSIADKRARLK